MNPHAQELALYTPAITLERFISQKNQHRFWLWSLTLSIGVVGGWSYYAFFLQTNPPDWLLGLGFISGALLIDTLLGRMFHNSFYFRNFSYHDQAYGITYEVARLLTRHPNDIARAVCESPQGKLLLLRLGINSEQTQSFLISERTKISKSDLVLTTTNVVTFSDIVTTLEKSDIYLQKFLQSHAITSEVFTGALDWVTREYYQYKQAQRWWSREQLGARATFGQQLAFGRTYLLDTFSQSLVQNSVFSSLITQSNYATEKVLEIEAILGRSREANAIIVGNAGVGKMDMLLSISERIKRNTSLESLRGYECRLLDTDMFAAQFADKHNFEKNLIQLFQEAMQAGNVILIINNFAGFVRTGASLAIDTPAILDPYLNAPELKCVLISTPQPFHQEIERLPLRQKTEVVYIESPNLLGTERVLQDIVRVHEQKYGVWITYTGLQTIVQSADQYIVSGVMPDKAIDLFIEVLAAAQSTGVSLVDRTFVQSVVSQKTGIPLGPIQDTEKQRLLNLETTLHSQVTGQDAAISAISGALRRSRAGIQNTNRPIGSFLFLGPTGVGKTETAKALAAVFFAEEQPLQRIDMSEYSTTESFGRLFGDANQAGVVSDIIQSHPYTVILFDEFEKASQQIHDVFLQILDEGIFTSAQGTQVNLRNTILIISSNAGSNLILETIQNHKDLQSEKEVIIQNIIKSRIFRPELINRFDDVVLFEPLSLEQQTVIAQKLLHELSLRLKTQGYTVSFDERSLAHITQIGYSAEFGARPMRRAIQDTIEELVAQKIISGELTKGGSLTVTSTDLIIN